MIDGGFTTQEIVQVIKPAATTNLVSNPSFESATTGWAATSGAVTRVAGGRFGAWCGSLLASAQNGRADFTLPQATAGQPVTASIWVWSDSASVLLRLVQDAAVVEQAHPGDSAWHRLEVTATAATATTRNLRVIDTRAAGWTAVLIDGAQYEEGFSAATTYCDGDQDGCSWNGAAGLSTSTRDGRSGYGGVITSLEDLGFYTKQLLGMGAPPVEARSLDPALSDGSIFQRMRNQARIITLVGVLFGTGSLASLHTLRSSLIDAFKVDARSNRGPVMLRYTGASVSAPKLLPTYYQGGLEMDTIEAMDENIPLRMIAPQPDFVSETETSIALTASQNVAADGFAHRTADGVWSAIPTTITFNLDGIFWVTKLPDGRFVVSGQFTNLNGVAAADYLAVSNGSTWAALGGSVFGANVYQTAVSAAGKLWVVGEFTNANGDANQDYIAIYDIAAGTWSSIGTPPNARVYSIAIDPITGYVWVHGDFTSIGGTAAASGVAYFNGTAWVNASSGVSGVIGYHAGGTIVFGPDGAMYHATRTTIQRWSGTAWVTIGTSTNAAAAACAGLYSDGTYLYASHSLAYTLNSVTYNGIARYRGGIWEAMGSGILTSGRINTIGSERDGTIVVAGVWPYTIGGVTSPNDIATWNGSAWSLFPASPPTIASGSGDIELYAFTHSDGSLSLTWQENGIAIVPTANLIAPGQTTVTNAGSSLAYPVITIQTTGLLYSIRNRTTGQVLTFNNLNGAATGQITIDLRQKKKTITGVYGTNLLSTVLSASDLATFCLAPGANIIELYSSGTVTAQMRWRTQYWSAD